MYHSRIDTQLWQQHAWSNRLHSALLIALMGALLALLGGLLWGAEGVFILLLAGLVMVVVNPRVAPRVIMQWHGAKLLQAGQVPELHAIVQVLAQRAGLSLAPNLYYLPGAAINAFTVGRGDQAAIAISEGLLRALARQEQIGVLAHEISHIRSDDVWVMGLADQFSRLTRVLSFFGQVLLLINIPLFLLGQATINWWAVLILLAAPYVAFLAQLGLSRTREYDADLNAARLTGDPEGLARALMKIERLQGGWLEHLLLPARRLPVPAWLRTHPPTAERVQRLLDLKGMQLNPMLRRQLGLGARPTGFNGQGLGPDPRWRWLNS